MKHRPEPASLQRRAEADRVLFAARMRAARAVLGWSQTELGKKAGITQRAIYRLEKAAAKARHLTQVRIDKAFRDAGIEFAELPNGGFEMIVPDHVLTRARRNVTSQR
jgi:transcriptional regulator with XRE-family HTH domain